MNVGVENKIDTQKKNGISEIYLKSYYNNKKLSIETEIILGEYKKPIIADLIEKNMNELNESNILNEIFQIKRKTSNLIDKKESEKYQKGFFFSSRFITINSFKSQKTNSSFRK